MQRVKEEPREMEEDPACSYNTENSPDAARAVKQEIDVGPTVLQPTALHYITIEQIKEEPQQMQEETTCSYNTESSLGVARAVKIEIEIGPTVLQPTELHYMTMEPKFETSNEETAQCRREDTRDNNSLDKDTLLDHKKTPRVKREFKCDICGKLFSKNFSLKRHMVMHSGQRDHRCEICQKCFSIKELLKRHMVTHTGQRDHCCEICKKRFSRKEFLNKHMKTHTGQRDYCCEICQKCFLHKEVLKKHMITHTGQKEYLCEICQKSSARKDDLKKHMITHTGRRDHRCGICQKCFVQKQHLTKHMITHTGQTDHR